jgi:hypothetical protein
LRTDAEGRRIFDAEKYAEDQRKIGMKQDARKNWRKRKRNKRRLAMRKYFAEKKSKGAVA